MAEDRRDERPAADSHDELIQMRAEFEGSTTSLQRLAAQLRYSMGAPATALLVTGLIMVWVVANTALGRHALDPGPFEALNTVCTVAALIATLLILAGQRREDEAARRIARLTLHLAAESEQKIAKLIQLLEEQRRDNPTMPDRHDPEAEQMGASASPRQVLERLNESESI
jgi:uncharacterized membrane protein